METAPLFTDVADAPDGGAAWWLHAADGVRLRLGVWAEGDKGTVLLLNGRTEYIEKYGRAVRSLRERGYAMATLDWRGQGLADRLLANADIGHVADFADYQKDLSAMLAALDSLSLPGPRFLIGHSMGGAIGLRALIDGLKVNAAVFSAPMWGIHLAHYIRPAAWALSWFAGRANFGHRLSPGTTAQSYVTAESFDDNMLTTDRDMHDYMHRQITAHPQLSLGGPSLTWLFNAMTETRHLRHVAAPDTPALTFLGSRERIVDISMVHDRMARWPNATLRTIEGAEHEVMMERPALRERFFDESCAFFDARR